MLGASLSLAAECGGMCDVRGTTLLMARGSLWLMGGSLPTRPPSIVPSYQPRRGERTRTGKTAEPASCCPTFSRTFRGFILGVTNRTKKGDVNREYLESPPINKKERRGLGLLWPCDLFRLWKGSTASLNRSLLKNLDGDFQGGDFLVALPSSPELHV